MQVRELQLRAVHAPHDVHRPDALHDAREAAVEQAHDAGSGGGVRVSCVVACFSPIIWYAFSSAPSGSTTRPDSAKPVVREPGQWSASANQLSCGRVRVALKEILSAEDSCWTTYRQRRR